MNWYTTFELFLNTSTSWKLEIDTFSDSTNLWGLLGDYGASNTSRWWIMGLIRGLQVQIWAKLTSFTTSGSISPRMTVQKALIDTFSGGTNSWGLLGDSGLSSTACLWMMYLIRAYESTFRQNWPVLPVLDQFNPEWLYKRPSLIHFLILQIYGGFWEIIYFSPKFSREKAEMLTLP